MTKARVFSKILHLYHVMNLRCIASSRCIYIYSTSFLKLEDCFLCVIFFLPRAYSSYLKCSTHRHLHHLRLTLGMMTTAVLTYVMLREQLGNPNTQPGSGGRWCMRGLAARGRTNSYIMMESCGVFCFILGTKKCLVHVGWQLCKTNLC